MMWRKRRRLFISSWCTIDTKGIIWIVGLGAGFAHPRCTVIFSFMLLMLCLLQPFLILFLFLFVFPLQLFLPGFQCHFIRSLRIHRFHLAKVVIRWFTKWTNVAINCFQFFIGQQEATAWRMYPSIAPSRAPYTFNHDTRYSIITHTHTRERCETNTQFDAETCIPLQQSSTYECPVAGIRNTMSRLPP